MVRRIFEQHAKLVERGIRRRIPFIPAQIPKELLIINVPASKRTVYRDNYTVPVPPGGAKG